MTQYETLVLGVTIPDIGGIEGRYTLLYASLLQAGSRAKEVKILLPMKRRLSRVVHDLV